LFDSRTPTLVRKERSVATPKATAMTSESKLRIEPSLPHRQNGNSLNPQPHHQQNKAEEGEAIQT
jgi:hypothetical protein